MKGGHYISKCLVNNKWYSFNDSFVQLTSEIFSPNTYILFYEAIEK